MLKLRNAKKAVAMLITVAMCASLTPINKAYASDELTFGNGSSWGIYVATSKNVNTVAGYHGDTNKTQLDPAALSYYGQRDTSKSNDCYYASIVWLKPSATDLHWMYASHPSGGVWDSSKASCENFDIVNVAGSGQMKKETRTERRNGINSICRHTVFANIADGSIFRAIKQRTDLMPGTVAFFLVGDMNSCVPRVYNDTTKQYLSGNTLNIGVGEKVTLRLDYSSDNFNHTYKYSESNPSATVLSGDVDHGSRWFTVRGSKIGKNVITLYNTVDEIVSYGYKVAPDTTITVNVVGPSPEVNSVKATSGLSLQIVPKNNGCTISQYGYATKGSSNITWKTTSTVTVPKEGEYDFYVKGSDGTISAPYTLSVKATNIKPKITVVYDYIYHSEGIEFTVYASDSDGMIDKYGVSLDNSGNNITWFGEKAFGYFDVPKETTSYYFWVLDNNGAMSDVYKKDVTGIKEFRIHDAKTVYKLGEEFKTGDSKCTIDWSNGKSDTWDTQLNWVTGFNTNSLGTKTLEVRLNGAYGTYDIEVVPNDFDIQMEYVGIDNEPVPIHLTEKAINTADYTLPEPADGGDIPFLGYSLGEFDTQNLYQAGETITVLNTDTIYAQYGEQTVAGDYGIYVPVEGSTYKHGTENQPKLDDYSLEKQLVEQDTAAFGKFIWLKPDTTTLYFKYAVKTDDDAYVMQPTKASDFTYSTINGKGGATAFTRTESGEQCSHIRFTGVNDGTIIKASLERKGSIQGGDYYFIFGDADDYKTIVYDEFQNIVTSVSIPEYGEAHLTPGCNSNKLGITYVVDKIIDEPTGRTTTKTDTTTGNMVIDIRGWIEGTDYVVVKASIPGVPYDVIEDARVDVNILNATPIITSAQSAGGLRVNVNSRVDYPGLNIYLCGYSAPGIQNPTYKDVTWSSTNTTLTLPSAGEYDFYVQSNLGKMSKPYRYTVTDKAASSKRPIITNLRQKTDRIDGLCVEINGYAYQGTIADYGYSTLDGNPVWGRSPVWPSSTCVSVKVPGTYYFYVKDSTGLVSEGYPFTVVGYEHHELDKYKKYYKLGEQFVYGDAQCTYRIDSRYAMSISKTSISQMNTAGFNTDTLGKHTIKVFCYDKYHTLEYYVVPNIYNVTIKTIGAVADDITATAPQMTTSENAKYVLPSPAPIQESKARIMATGPQFVGFSESETNQTDLMQPGDEIELTSDKTLYAHYVMAKTIDRLDVIDPITEYELNSTFSPAGQLKVTYSDGTEELLPLVDEMIDNFDTSTSGDKEVLVVYEGATTSYGITVKKDPNDHGAITGIVVSGQTTEYPLDAPFDDNGTVTITYEDGTTSDIPLTSDMLSGFDTSAVGTVPITVTHEGHEATYDITVIDPDDHGDITGIVVSGTTPTYEKDDPFDGKGTVQVVYEDGTTVDIPLTEDMLSNFDTSTPGTVTVTVTHEGHTDTFDIEVTEGGDTPDPDDHGAITGITVSGVTTEYDKDEPFDNLGTVVVEYEDGTTKDIPLTEDMLSGFDTSTPGTVTVTVTYEGTDATYDIEVTEPIIEDKVIKTIKVVGLTKNYMVDEPFDNRGTIIIVYSDYSVDDIPVTEDMLTNFDTSSPGTVTVTLNYEDYTEDYVINVDEPFVPAGEIAEISVYDYVDEYMVYDDFIKQGTVAINYTDDTTDEVPLQKDMLTGFETSEVGNVNVLVTLGEATTDYDITVYDLDKEIVGIKVSDETTSYEVGDDFDGKGIITVYYDDGTSEEFPLTEDMLEGFDTSAAGKVEVMVVYEDFADTYVINVKAQQEPDPEPYITGITVSGIQTTYTKGDNLNTTNGKVTLHWSDGTTTQVDLTPNMVTGFDTNKVGTYPITVTHKGFTTDINITIKEPSNPGSGSGGSGGSSGGSSSGGGGGSSHRPSKPSTSKPDTTTTIDDTKTPLVDKPSIQAPGLDSEGNQFKLNTGIGLHSLGDKGYIAGYPDTTFKPAQGITRAEFAAILYRVFTFDNTKTAKSFIDVKPEAWYYDAVQTLTANNIIYGYPNNEFKPNDKISVADALLMLGRLIDLSSYDDTTNNQYVANSAYSKEALARAINSGIVGNDVNVDTTKEITREQVVEFINNIIYDTLETSKPNRFIDINTSMETYKDIIKAAILK